MDARNSGMALALIAVLSSPHPSTSVYLQRTRIDHMMSTVLAHAPSIAFTSASTSSPISISTSTTTIHIQCLSVLQHLYNDAEIAPHLTHYIPPSFNVTIAAFAHASAIVVNAGSQLLVVLAQHVVRGSSTARELFGRMPELERVVRWCLSDSGESATDDAVYGVLSLLVQLEKDDQSCGQHAQGTLWNEWRDVLLPLVGHRSWNVSRVT